MLVRIKSLNVKTAYNAQEVLKNLIESFIYLHMFLSILSGKKCNVKMENNF